MQLQEDIYTSGGVQTHTLATMHKTKMTKTDKHTLNKCLTK